MHNFEKDENMILMNNKSFLDIYMNIVLKQEYFVLETWNFYNEIILYLISIKIDIDFIKNFLKVNKHDLDFAWKQNEI